MTTIPAVDGGNLIGRLRESFEGATRKTEVHTTFHCMGGAYTRLRVVGEALNDTIRAPLSHVSVQSPNASYELNIDLWDESATGVRRPFEWLRDEFYRTIEFGRAVLAFNRDGSIVGYQSPQMAAVYDRHSHRIVGSVSQTGMLSLWEQGKPLLHLLSAWHNDRGVVPIHAGMVAMAGRGILFGGTSGSGKTTTSLLCLRSGFSYLGDDSVGLEQNGDDIIGHSFYCSSWLTPQQLARFPDLVMRATPGRLAEDKLYVLLSEGFGNRLAKEAIVKVLALPRVTGREESYTRRIALSEALLRLAPSSIIQLPFIDGHASLSMMSTLVESVPCFELGLGSDLTQIPPIVERLLDADF